jgi:hypothetical protein
MREPRRLTTLWPFMACYRDSFKFLPDNIIRETVFPWHFNGLYASVCLHLFYRRKWTGNLVHQPLISTANVVFTGRAISCTIFPLSSTKSHVLSACETTMPISFHHKDAAWFWGCKVFPANRSLYIKATDAVLRMRTGDWVPSVCVNQEAVPSI